MDVTWGGPIWIPAANTITLHYTMQIAIPTTTTSFSPPLDRVGRRRRREKKSGTLKGLAEKKMTSHLAHIPGGIRVGAPQCSAWGVIHSIRIKCRSPPKDIIKFEVIGGGPHFSSMCHLSPPPTYISWTLFLHHFSVSHPGFWSTEAVSTTASAPPLQGRSSSQLQLQQQLP